MLIGTAKPDWSSRFASVLWTLTWDHDVQCRVRWSVNNGTHFTTLSETSTLKTFPLRGSVAKVLSTVCPSRKVRLSAVRNCRTIGSGNCPDDDCEEVSRSPGTATSPSTHERSRSSFISNRLSFVR